jgi:hypothetical protein
VTLSGNEACSRFLKDGLHICVRELEEPVWR